MWWGFTPNVVGVYPKFPHPSVQTYGWSTLRPSTLAYVTGREPPPHGDMIIENPPVVVNEVILISHRIFPFVNRNKVSK